VPPPGPSLPAGHPFSPSNQVYWSATTSAANPSEAWFANFAFGVVNDGIGKLSPNRAWWVRGGHGVDPQ